jgi:hypothetical protein
MHSHMDMAMNRRKDFSKSLRFQSDASYIINELPSQQLELVVFG